MNFHVVFSLLLVITSVYEGISVPKYTRRPYIVDKVKGIKIHEAHWDYEGENGPDYWGKNYPYCNGNFQSPIDIENEDVVVSHYPPFIARNFDKHLVGTKLSNNGHTAVLSIIKGGKPEILGGPLTSVYQFEQFHFHWGTTDSNGSEGTINNKTYAAELHMVFFKEDYGNFDNAVDYKDGLCVLAFFYELGLHNPYLDPLIDSLQYIQRYNASVNMYNFQPLNNLIYYINPSQYFAYKGSLTTPPCNEAVIWMEFPETIPISHDQIESFRSLLNTNNKNITHNFRPTQPLNGRKVYWSRISQ